MFLVEYCEYISVSFFKSGNFFMWLLIWNISKLGTFLFYSLDEWN